MSKIDKAISEYKLMKGKISRYDICIKYCITLGKFNYNYYEKPRIKKLNELIENSISSNHIEVNAEKTVLGSTSNRIKVRGLKSLSGGVNKTDPLSRYITPVVNIPDVKFNNA